MADEQEQIAALEAEALAADAPETVETPAVEADVPAVDPNVEADARRLGWKPESEWKGDKTGWVDAASFMDQVKTVPGKVKRLEADFAARVERLEKAHAEASKRQAETHKAELARVKAEMRKAVEIGDTEAFDRLEKQRDAMQEPPKVETTQETPPETREWKARNPWFDANAEMRTVALNLAQEAADKGLSVEAQLAFVDREIARFFPDVAPKQIKRPTHSAVDGGSFAAPRSSPAAKLPAEARAQGMRDVAEGLFKSLDEYATAYFEG